MNFAFKKGFAIYSLSVLISVSGVFIGIFILSNAAQKAIISEGGVFEVAAMLIAAAVFPLWILLLTKGKYLQAVGFEILALAVTGRAESAFGLKTFEVATGSAQRLSLTTFMIFFVFFVLIIKHVPVRRSNSSFRIFELILWIFSIFVTASQLMNHNLYHAVLLSVGGVWQYLIFFYILSGTVKEQKHLRFIIKCLVGAILIGVAVRLGSGTGYIVEWHHGSEVLRFGGIVFGSATTYGAHLSLILFLSLYLLRTAKTSWQRAMWTCCLCVVCLEILFTHTRGAFLAFFLIFLLVLWKRQWRFFSYILGICVLLSPFLFTTVMDFISSRGFFLDSRMMNIGGVSGRFDLYEFFLPHFFDNFGFGYGMYQSLSTYVWLGSTLRYLGPHSVILDISQGAGGIAALAFIVMYLYVCLGLWKSSIGKSDTKSVISVFLLLGLIAWLFVANTSSTAILCYFPYEGIMLMYTTLFLSLIWLSTATNKA